MTTRHPNKNAPHPLHSATEFRALLELATLPYSMPLLMTAPLGDGHPVLLLPGFLASENSLFALRFSSAIAATTSTPGGWGAMSAS